MLWSAALWAWHCSEWLYDHLGLQDMRCSDTLEGYRLRRRDRAVWAERSRQLIATSL